MTKGKKIILLFGGQSSEHEISLKSAGCVVKNIDAGKHDIVMIGITRDGRWLNYRGSPDKIADGSWEKDALKQSRESSPVRDENTNSVLEMINNAAGGKSETEKTVIFPVLHGVNGEDGTIQGLFELAGFPYVGCGVLSSSIGMDKGFAKIVFGREKIPQGKYIVMNRKNISGKISDIAAKIRGELGYPCFIKPCNAGSSVGVGKAENESKLETCLIHAMQYDRRIIAEEFIKGREMECAVLGNDAPRASVVGEIIPGSDFYDYNAKYSSKSRSRVAIPADIPEKTAGKIRKYAIKAFKALDCSGLSRVDFFLRDNGDVLINEINTMPGFTDISMYPKLWEASGISYQNLIEKLIELASERHRETFRATCSHKK
ncbi:MAG: D-alanine--D-alanine ligase [Eubacteriales bacterium]|nr:D-alanine--D-alanine ligase [Eubacteriales bacterium]